MPRIDHALDDAADSRHELRFINNDAAKVIEQLQVRLWVGKHGQIVIIFARKNQMTIAFHQIVEKRRFSYLSWSENDFCTT